MIFTDRVYTLKCMVLFRGRTLGKCGGSWAVEKEALGV